MKYTFKQLICSTLLLAMLSACSSVPTSIRSPAGVKVADSWGTPVGVAPTTVSVQCGPPTAIGLLMWFTLVLAPVEMMMQRTTTDFDITLDEQTLRNAGLSNKEVAEALSTGNTIRVSFVPPFRTCAEAAKFELDNKSIRAVLLEGESATYTWHSAGGGGIYATMRRKN